jgi:hypothetical protein
LEEAGGKLKDQPVFAELMILNLLRRKCGMAYGYRHSAEQNTCVKCLANYRLGPSVDLPAEHKRLHDDIQSVTGAKGAVSMS